jgi:hypothetical protein
MPEPDDAKKLEGTKYEAASHETAQKTPLVPHQTGEIKAAKMNRSADVTQLEVEMRRKCR